ncbi:MAG: hypothetical protein ACHQF0_17860, partial [Chitinophagales bacterium]
HQILNPFGVLKLFFIFKGLAPLAINILLLRSNNFFKLQINSPHNSQLTTHNSQLTTHNSQLTTHNSQLTTHNFGKI